MRAVAGEVAERVIGVLCMPPPCCAGGINFADGVSGGGGDGGERGGDRRDGHGSLP